MPRRRAVPRRSETGFTLIELMVVIVILGLLAGIVTPNVTHFLLKGKVSTTKANIASLKQAVESYRMEKNSLPDSLDDLKDYVSDGTIPKDGWGNDFHYVKTNKRQYDIVSYGADGEEGPGTDDGDQDINIQSLHDDGNEKTPGK